MAQTAKSCDDIFNQLVQGGVSPEELYDTVCKQVIVLFFTCHVHRLISKDETEIERPSVRSIRLLA